MLAIVGAVIPVSVAVSARAEDTARETVRGAAAGAAEQPAVTLLAFGDSLTQGYGLEQGDGLVPQLQSWLAAHGAGAVDIVNGGVSGDTTTGGLARIDWSLTPDIDAMMVILGGNDLLRGTDPAVTGANLDGILDAGQAKGLPMMLVGMQATANFGAGFKAEFDALYPDLAARYDTVFVPSFYAPLTGGSDDPVQMRNLLQADGIHPNRDGVSKIVATLGPAVLELLDRVEAP
ncbi:arylesterase [Pseudooceanicola sediminis]|uniref:Arylesterase n=1 Tax=Pseudooceanicola sediminis TaxID=2211117 RepID=A0A399J3S9_9RHOB|nr:arylesterase [Pseudooceanicola sediminis]KAA2313654.1 arylesterase [Puniceibacterium sp. HSS470]RII38612.1 arylesterase [Pseudooceanicola sediminis]